MTLQDLINDIDKLAEISEGKNVVIPKAWWEEMKERAEFLDGCLREMIKKPF